MLLNEVTEHTNMAAGRPIREDESSQFWVDHDAVSLAAGTAAARVRGASARRCSSVAVSAIPNRDRHDDGYMIVIT